jgi:hypothetical protein
LKTTAELRPTTRVSKRVYKVKENLIPLIEILWGKRVDKARIYLALHGVQGVVEAIVDVLVNLTLEY